METHHGDTKATGVITAASLAAAAVELASMTPAQLTAIRARIVGRAVREERRRQDFALHLQIQADPRYWI